MRDPFNDSKVPVTAQVYYKYNISIFCFPLCLSDSLSMLFSNVLCGETKLLILMCFVQLLGGTRSFVKLFM